MDEELEFDMEEFAEDVEPENYRALLAGLPIILVKQGDEVYLGPASKLSKVLFTPYVYDWLMSQNVNTYVYEGPYLLALWQYLRERKNNV